MLTDPAASHSLAEKTLIMMRPLHSAFVAACAVAVVLRTAPVSAESAPPPVVLLNGLAGAVFNAKYDKKSVPHFYCSKSSKGEFERIWVSVKELVPGVIDCMFDTMVLHYENGSYSNTEGVTLDTSVDFGGVGGLEYLDPSITASGYFHDIIDSLEKNLKYTVGKSLRGAPYDWRLAPDGLAKVTAGDANGTSFYDRLRSLVEETVSMNEGRRVVLVSHSMGGPVTLAFLQRQSSEWKSQYIRGFIPLAPPFAGAVSTLKAVISGDTLGVPIVSHSLFHPIQSTCASGPWLLPQPKLWNDEILVKSSGSSFAADAYADMLSRLGLTQALDLIEDGVNGIALRDFTPPGVPVHVLRGTGVATDAAYTYSDTFQNGKVPSAPTISYEYGGDGTVNDRSLGRAQEWIDNGEPANITSFQNRSHFGMLMDNEVIGFLENLLRLWSEEARPNSASHP